jgi:hypothetical protein
MAKWQKLDASGISIGGEFYPSDERGVVDIPDNVGGLGEYGFTRFLLDDVAGIAAKANAAKLAGEASPVEVAKVADELPQHKKKKGAK